MLFMHVFYGALSSWRPVWFVIVLAGQPRHACVCGGFVRCGQKMRSLLYRTLLDQVLTPYPPLHPLSHTSPFHAWDFSACARFERIFEGGRCVVERKVVAAAACALGAGSSLFFSRRFFFHQGQREGSDKHWKLELHLFILAWKRSSVLVRGGWVSSIGFGRAYLGCWRSTCSVRDDSRLLPRRNDGVSFQRRGSGGEGGGGLP